MRKLEKFIRCLQVAASSLVLCCCGFYNPAFAQTKAQVKNVDFEMINNEVIITYDIVKHQSNEMFKVWVKVYTAQENELKAQSLTGAVGENVSGGDHKKIIWDPAKDGVYLDNDIYIEVFAKSTVSMESSEGVSMGKWMLLSVLYPGVGNAKLNSKKLWLTSGALGYGCMIGSVLMNGKASGSYDDYLLSQEISERNRLYDHAGKQKQLSAALFVSGTAIWATDLLLLALKVKKSKLSARSENINPVYLGFSNEPIGGYATQQVSLKIIF